jgi:sulfatase maturation enzyme AslB (radical SAM superfamily)
MLQTETVYARNVSSRPFSIESGYFVLTLMPSLFCKLRCPHCYLSLEQRKDRTVMAVEQLKTACEKIDAYYQQRKIPQKTIVCYWYGGEPTSMGQEYFVAAAEAINGVFALEKGYEIRHTVLTALVGVESSWFDIFDHYGKGAFQTSYDGLMRGAGYMRRWEKAVREATGHGLKLSTISVVNRALLDQGPVETLDYLASLGVTETSWLPFMWNDQNSAGAYEQFAPRMVEYDEFMIAMTKHWIVRKKNGDNLPEIGQMRFILGQEQSELLANIAGQTLFLLPNGEFVLPDYREGWKEFMQPFGNILEHDFETVLSSPARRRYLRRQVLRNGNPECQQCDHTDKCIMEFWKDNRVGDDCFGAKTYVEWVLANRNQIDSVGGITDTVLY